MSDSDSDSDSLTGPGAQFGRVSAGLPADAPPDLIGMVTFHGNPEEVGIVDDFEHVDLSCRVMKHPAGHYCGYVQASAAIATILAASGEDIEKRVDTHGGITYGPDEEGWIGFDCGHGFDICLDENGERWGILVEYGVGDYGDELNREWTPEAVTEEVKQFAEQVRALEAEREL